MNGNYYLNKLKIKLRNRNTFVWIFTIVVFLINYDIASGFFHLKEAQNFVVNPKTLDILKPFLGKHSNPINLFSPDILLFLKIYYCAISVISLKALGVFVFEFFLKRKSYNYDEIKENDVIAPKFPYDQDKLQLVIGLKHKEENEKLVEHPNWVVVPERGLFQDFLICGGKGTGKTQACMYPFTKQMVYYKAYSESEKTGMLILDVKGNYTKEALKCAQQVNRDEDVVVINLSGKYKYNPLHKPGLKTQVIANRLRTVLELFSTQHSDTYWLDKAEVLLNEALKLVRLYNKGYVTFVEVHKVVNNEEYLNEKIEELQEIEDRNKLTRNQRADFRTVKDYFLNEYKTLDTKISSVIKSEVTRMTYTFISDPEILSAFCAPQEKLNFFGFDDLVDTGKIVVLDMNIAEFRNLSKIIAAYLKLDFQSAALIRLTREGANTTRPLIFISDEYQEYVTVSDADFYSVSREAKCVNIVSSQSYSSLLKTLKSEEALQTILTNLTNKIWLRTDDKKTGDAAVAQCGTVIREDVSKGFSENAKLGYSNMMGRKKKQDATFNENLNISLKFMDKFKITTFTVDLPIFKAIAYLSDGNKIMPPTMVHLEPYFEEIYTNLYKGVRPAIKKVDASKEIQPHETFTLDDDVSDNYNFEENKVEGPVGITVENEKEIEGEVIDKVEDIKFEDDEDIKFEDEEDDFVDFGPTKPKKPKTETFVPKYLDKEVEEDLKKVEGIFDED